MGVLAITQAAGWTGVPPVYAAQAATPYLLAPAVPIGVAALRGRRPLLALTCAGVATALGVLVAPVVRQRRRTPPCGPTDERAGGPVFTVLHANAFFRTDEPAAAAEVLAGAGADVVAVVELSVDLERALRERGVDAAHPWHVGTRAQRRNGIALLSRFPVVSSRVGPIGGQTAVDATVDVHGRHVRILVVHPLPGVDRHSLRRLRHDLRAIAARAGDDDLPTLVVGDFNAGRWHPMFRRQLLARFRDVHESVGRGFSVSWPVHRFVPAWVRLDHGLVDDGVEPLDVDDLDLPGSDHRAFVARLRLRDVSG